MILTPGATYRLISAKLNYISLQNCNQDIGSHHDWAECDMH